MDQQLKKHSEAYFKYLIEKLEVDVLFECFVGILAQAEGIDPEKIHVIPKDNHQRNFKHDIIPIEEDLRFGTIDFFEEDLKGTLKIFTSRSAILDYLPEEIYTEPDNTNEYYDEHGRLRSKEDIENYRLKKEAQVRSANRFFKPLEVEYNKVRVYRELQELQQLSNFDSLLQDFWDEFEVDSPAWNRFIRTLHLAPEVLGDRHKTQALIEYVLEQSIELEFTVDPCYTMSEAERKALMGEQQIMGYNMSVGKLVYDYLEVCTLRLLGLSTETFFRYNDPNSSERKLLEKIINYYFPLNLELQLDFTIDQTKDENTEEKTVVLGFSSILQ